MSELIGGKWTPVEPLAVMWNPESDTDYQVITIQIADHYGMNAHREASVSDRVDVVAQAIWRAGYPRESDGRTWHDLVNKRYFRAMAQAAIDALELTTEEWGYSWAPGKECEGLHAGESLEEAQRIIDALNGLYPAAPNLRYPVSRLVSPWVRKDNSDE
ncbi:hypothetical protein ACX9NE_26945 [Mycobacterium sp. ML4]